MTTDDPFTLFYDALHAYVLESVGVQEQIKQASSVVSINTGHGKDKLRDAVTDAHLPEVVVHFSGTTGNITIASGAAMLTRQYVLRLSTESDTIGKTLFPLEFAIFAAIAAANQDVAFRNLRWRDKEFVVSISLVGGDAGDSDPEANRQIKGWAAVWTIEVAMQFSLPDLLAVRSG